MWLVMKENVGLKIKDQMANKIKNQMANNVFENNVTWLLANEGLLSCSSRNYIANKTSTKPKWRSVIHQELITQEGNSEIEIKVQTLTR